MIGEKVIEEGVAVVNKAGKFWGKQYEDGRSTEYGWGAASLADIGSRKYSTEPEDFTYRGSHYVNELKTNGTVVSVRRITYIEEIK